MRRYLFALAAGLLAGAVASAHFVFAVPAKDGKSVEVVLSENLDVDENVPADKFAGIKLTALLADGKTAAVAGTKGPHSVTAAIPAGAKLITGSVDYGVMQRGDAKPYLLKYHPKAVLAGCDAKAATLGEAAAVELVPVFGGKVAFRVLAAGKPVADAEVTVIKPDGKSEKVKTDKDGATPGFDGAGRYGAWVKSVEGKAGELDGKKYDEIRHYATAVADFGK